MSNKKGLFEISKIGINVIVNINIPSRYLFPSHYIKGVGDMEKIHGPEIEQILILSCIFCLQKSDL